MFSISCMLVLFGWSSLSFIHLAFGEFELPELCRLTLLKFCIKVLRTKRNPNSPPLGPSILTPGSIPVALQQWEASTPTIRTPATTTSVSSCAASTPSPTVPLHRRCLRIEYYHKPYGMSFFSLRASFGSSSTTHSLRPSSTSHQP
jgi:hypothetical protein